MGDPEMTGVVHAGMTFGAASSLPRTMKSSRPALAASVLNDVWQSALCSVVRMLEGGWTLGLLFLGA
eukprot:scaffold255552_cov35-Attheya_sp.AAC.1